MMRACIVVLLFFIIPSLAFAKDVKPEQRTVSAVMLSTETIDDDWIDSQFTSLLLLRKGNAIFNECEQSVSDAMSPFGLSCKVGKYKRSKLVRIRSFRTVVGRYKDISSMPNFTAIRASLLLSQNASYVILCNVDVSSNIDKNGYKTCGNGRCKIIDIKDSKRVAFAGRSACTQNEDRTTANIGTIRDICEGMGKSMGESIKHIISDGGDKR